MVAAGLGYRPVRKRSVPEVSEDASLVGAARDGDRGAFGRLYDLYARMVHRVLGLNQLHTDGSIAWNDVTVSLNLRGEFPREVALNRYYAARETSSAPLRVKTPAGEQAREISFLSRSFERSTAAVCHAELRRRAAGQESGRRRNSSHHSLRAPARTSGLSSRRADG
jgi:hypothetical protein